MDMEESCREWVWFPLVHVELRNWKLCSGLYSREKERESGGPYLHIYSFSRKSTKSYLTKKKN